MVVQSSRQMLILQRRVRLTTPVLVIYEGSATSRKALATAKAVTPEGSAITVLIIADHLDQAQELQAEAHDQLGELGDQARFSWRRDLGGGRIAQLARHEGCGLLLLPVEAGRLASDDLLQILSETSCAVLLIR
jgi:hypothetical protein